MWNWVATCFITLPMAVNQVDFPYLKPTISNQIFRRVSHIGYWKKMDQTCLPPESERECDHRVGLLWHRLVTRPRISLAICLDKRLNSESSFCACQDQQWDSSCSGVHANHPYWPSNNVRRLCKEVSATSVRNIQSYQPLRKLDYPVCLVQFLWNKSIFPPWSIFQMPVFENDSLLLWWVQKGVYQHHALLPTFLPSSHPIRLCYQPALRSDDT